MNEKKKVEVLGTTDKGKKKGKKKKEKEISQEELDLNNQIGANMEIGNDRERRGRGREGRGRGGRRGGKGGQFHFNEKDFPKFEKH